MGRSPSWGTSPSELWCTVCRRLFSLLKVPLALRRRPCYSGRWRTSASARRMRVPQGSWRAWSPPLCQRGAGLLARESQTLSGRSLSSGTSRNPLLLDPLCEVVHGRLGDMDPSLVLRTLSSLSRLGHCPSDSVLQAIWEQCQHYRASYTQREFTRLVALFNSFGHERRQRGGGSGDAFIMLPRKTPSAAPPP